jgi:hypothetical protein
MGDIVRDIAKMILATLLWCTRAEVQSVHEREGSLAYGCTTVYISEDMVRAQICWIRMCGHSHLNPPNVIKLSAQNNIVQHVHSLSCY